MSISKSKNGMIRFNAMWLLLRSLIGIMFAFANIILGQYSKRVYDEAILAGSQSMLWYLGSTYLLSVLFFLATYTIQDVIIVYIEERSSAKLRCDVFSGYLSMPLIEMEELSTGDVFTRMTSDVDNMKPLGGTVWVDIANGLVMLIALLWWMFSVNSLLAFLLLPAPLLFCIAMMYFSTKVFTISEKLQTLLAKTNSLLAQIVAGANTVRIFLLKPIMKQNFSRSAADLSAKIIQKDITNAKIQSVWNLVMIPYQAVFFLIAGWIYMLKGNPSIGTILVFSNLSSFLIYPLMSLLSNVANLGSMFASKQRVVKMLTHNAPSQTAQTAQSASGDIVLCSVDFSYGNTKVLNDITLRIPEKLTTIIWGESGAGKSTLAKLLLGLYVPDKGSIMVSNLDGTRKITDCSNRISFLEQQPFIFEGTVRANITLGCDSPSDAQLRIASKNAGVLDRVEQLSHGFDTMLDEKTPLSGGEKQRLALARCLIRDSDIYILDELTSSQHAELSHEIMKCLQTYYPTTTKIIISHDPSMLQYAECIVTLAKGSVTDVVFV